jgi:hypothetical protein
VKAARRKARLPIRSTTESRDETDLQDAFDTTAISIRSDPVPVEAGTQFAAPADRTEATSGRDSVGRTVYDLLYPYASNPRYLYLLIPLIVGLAFGTTGHLLTWDERASAGGLILLCWLVLPFVQRKR